MNSRSQKAKKYCDWPKIIIIFYFILLNAIGIIYYFMIFKDHSVEKEWHDLLFGVAGLCTAIAGLLHSGIRIHRTEQSLQAQEKLRREDNERQETLRREDEQIRIYMEALEKLYNIENFYLQLLGIRELYDLYPDKSKDESILIAKFNKSLKIKILNCISEYLRDIDKKDKNNKDDIKINPSVRNRILELFFYNFSKELGNKEYPKDYKFNLKGANLHEANLEGVNLHGANLYGTELEGANLLGAHLEGAIVSCIVNNIEEGKDYDEPLSTWEEEAKDCWEEYGWTAKTTEGTATDGKRCYIRKLFKKENTDAN